MKLYLDEKEVTIKELKEAWNNLDSGPADGGDFEEIILDRVTDEELYFTTCVFNSF